MRYPKWEVVVPIKTSDAEGAPVFWHVIGAAWKGKQKDSINIKLNSLPMTDRIFLFVRDKPAQPDVRQPPTLPKRVAAKAPHPYDPAVPNEAPPHTDDDF